jgi:hypothetical protein
MPFCRSGTAAGARFEVLISLAFPQLVRFGKIPGGGSLRRPLGHATQDRRIPKIGHVLSYRINPINARLQPLFSEDRFGTAFLSLPAFGRLRGGQVTGVLRAYGHAWQRTSSCVRWRDRGPSAPRAGRRVASGMEAATAAEPASAPFTDSPAPKGDAQPRQLSFDVREPDQNNIRSRSSSTSLCNCTDARNASVTFRVFSELHVTK